MNGALSYFVATFTSDWANTAFIIVLMVGGIRLVRSGRARVLSPTTQMQSEPTLQRWLSRVYLQSVLDPVANGGERDRWLRQRAILTGYSSIGSGTMSILASLLLTVLALALQSSHSLDKLYSVVSTTVLYLTFATGPALGYFFGTRVLAQRPDANTFHGDVRSLRDYCSLWLWIIPLIVACLAFALFLQASLGAQFDAVGWFGMPRHLPAVGGIVAVLFLLSVIVPALCAVWVSRFPNAITVTDPTISQRANDSLRASLTAATVFFLWVSCVGSSLALSAFKSATEYQRLGISLVPLSNIVDLAILLMILGAVPMAWLLWKGRMGGRLTGWPWQRRPVQRERAAAEGRE